MLIEVVYHEMRVFLRDAEAECFHVADVCGVAKEGVSDGAGALAGQCAFCGVKAFEFAHVVFAACPFDFRKAHGVRDPEVVERAEKTSLDGIGQAYFCGDMSAEVGEDVSPIHTLWGSGEAEEDLRVKVCEKMLVGFRCGVMEFIDDDHVVVVGIHFFKEALTVQRLNGHEEVFHVTCPISSDGKRTEVRIFHDLTEAGEALFEDFFSMGDEEEARPFFSRGGKSAIVEGGNRCLSGAGDGDDKIVPAIFAVPLCVERIQYGLLVRIRLDVKGIGGGIFLAAPPAFSIYRSAKFFLIFLRLVGG